MSALQMENRRSVLIVGEFNDKRFFEFGNSWGILGFSSQLVFHAWPPEAPADSTMI
jgi:hypothetical protein